MNKASLNKVILIGRLGKDPEQQQTPGGTAIVKFSIATTESRKVGNEYKDFTEWHNLVAFGSTAEFIGKYIGKGRLVNVEGRLKTSNWESNGVKHYKTEIMVDSCVLLDKAPQGTNFDKGWQTYQQPTNAQPTQKAVENQAND